MRRDDFTVEGIPDGYEVRGVDLTPSGMPVCVLAHRDDYTQELFLLFPDLMTPIPEDAVFRLAHVSHVFVPIVRCMDEERVLLVGSGEICSEKDGQPRCKTNARVLNHKGHVEQSFHIGHADEVTANENWIVTHYGDQVMTSDYHPVDREGLAVFDATGTFLWGFGSHFAGKPRLDVFFHAAVWVGPDDVGVYRLIERKVSTLEGFIRLNVRERSQQVWRVPQEGHLAWALTTIGDRVLFHSPRVGVGIIDWLKVKAGRMSQPPGEGDIVEWEVGSDHCRVVGHYAGRGTLRGLPGGRFIASKTHGYTILSFD